MSESTKATSSSPDGRKLKTFPGLFYRAAWGDALDALVEGEKVKAEGDSLYLGVVRQTGQSGFYKVYASEE